MIEALLALDRYRDAVELRARYEAVFSQRADRPSAIKLAAMHHDERGARAALEQAFRLAFAPVPA
jgi:hypothetical protein